MKLPTDAKLVFKGILHDVYQWEQEMFDGSKATFEGVKEKDVISVIAVKDGKILISDEEQPHAGDFYGLFGGFIEEGENPLEAGKRELKEEAGLESDDWEMFSTYDFPFIKVERTIYFYMARNCKKVSEPNLEPGEKIKTLELDFPGFMEIMKSKKLKSQHMALELFRMSTEELEAFKQKLFS